MPAKGSGRPWPELGNPPNGLSHQAHSYLVWYSSRGYSSETLVNMSDKFRMFLEWCSDRALTSVEELTPHLFERYQRHVSEKRTKSGSKISTRTQLESLGFLIHFCGYLVRTGIVQHNAASIITLPRTPQRLPRSLMTLEEMDILLSQPDLSTALGIRDRAMLEVVFATALRSVELVALSLEDFDSSRKVLHVGSGPNRREREIPIYSRTVDWVHRYFDESRIVFSLEHPEDRALFIGQLGKRLAAGYVEHLFGYYAQSAGFEHGSIFRRIRDTVGVEMFDSGADARYVQEVLGHVCLQSTLKYARLSISRLCKVHGNTHPAELNRRGYRK